VRYQTRRFNQEAASLDSNIAIITVSTDLPYAIKNYCAASGVDKVMAVSDHADGNFGEKYGTLVKERRIHRRAIFVVDKNNKITYADYMPALGDQPNYEEVLAAAKEALKS
jgi:thiol peroxidase